ncbi:MAG: hemagglutinin repeat-containing protein [Moraxellaceae bacterium]
MNRNSLPSRRTRTVILRRKPLAAAIAIILAVTPVWSADIAPANGNTTMFNHPSGVPVVNIAAPNAAGLSHNQYNAFNVPTQGAVLNNATQVTMSQLAGSVPVNTNLGGHAANVILNEVVTANRSQLNGFLEVAGQQAGVIVANPYGITCNGCGFINTPRVTLTTGVPNFAGDGSLSGFIVNAGNVLINGGGINASAQNILDVVARSVTLDGQVNGQDVQVVAGSNSFDYDARSVSGSTAGSGTAPSHAIDSTALGGLYANRIRLIATENNVGVRMLGEAAATTDDLVLTSAGKIELRNKASAARDVSVTYTGSAATDADAITLGGSGLNAGRDLLVSGGGLVLDGGTFGANGDLMFDVASLLETGAAGERFAAGDIVINSSGSVALSGSRWDAGRAFSASAGTLGADSSVSMFASRNNTGSLSLTTVTGSLELGGSTLKNTGTINLQSAAGLSLAIGSDMQGGGNINLTAVTTLLGAGVIKAQQDIVLRAGSAATLAATLAGEVRAGGVLDVAGSGATPGKNTDLTVTGTTVASALKIKAEDVKVDGFLQGTSGTVLGADTLTISSSAKLVASDVDGAAVTLAVGTLGNEGYLQSKSRLNLNIGTLLENKSGASLLSASDIVLRSSSASGNIQINNAGVMQAGSPATGTTLLAGTSIDVAGYDDGSGANSAVNFSNSGNVYADVLTLRINTLDNSKLIAASRSDINVAGTLTNTANARLLFSQAATSLSTVTFSSLSNYGSLESQGALMLSAGSSINNSGKILGNDAVTIRASGSGVVSFANQNGALVQAGGKLDIGGQETAGAVARNINLDNAYGTFTGRQFSLKAGTVNNYGALQAGSVSNSVYSKVAGDTLVIDAISIINQVSGAKILGYDTRLTADTINNQGVIHAGNVLDVSAARIDNGRTGGISGLAQATLRTDRSVSGVSNELNNYGLILSNGALELRSANVIRNYADASNAGDIYATGNLTIVASQQVSNQGKLESKQGNIHITAPKVENNIYNPGKYWVTDSDVVTYQGDSGRYTGEAHDGRSGQTASGNYPGSYFRPLQGVDNRLFIDFYGTVAKHEEFNAPISALRPQIIAGAGNITIDGFQTLNNTGGLLSASGSVVLIGSSFINETLALYNQSYTYTGRLVFSCDYFYGTDAACADTGLAAPERHYLNTLNDQPGTPSYSLRSEIGAGVRAGGGIYFSGGYVANIGSPVGVGGKSDVQQGSTNTGSVGAGGAVTLGGGASVGLGLDLSLPTNPNGFFVPSRNPSSAYLIETNPLFGLDAAYLGSEYLAVKLNIPTDTMQRRLGDAAYENYLVRQQLIAQTGTNLIAGFKREVDQNQALLDNAVAAAHELNLVFGVALTEEQVNALTTDIVWAVEQMVAGQKVLVPVVYLSRATRAGVLHGAVIAATDINMDVDSLSNTGGTIAASNTLSVIAKDDIRNTAGTISAANMALVSTEGKIVNETIVTRTGDKDNYQDVASKTGSITASNNLIISGEKGVDIIGATVAAGDSAVIHSASGDIKITSLALESKTTTQKRENGLFSSSEEKTVATDQARLASSVTVGDGKNADAQLTLLAEKGNVNLLSADLASSGGINVMAKDINSSALNLTSSYTHSESSSGISSSGGALTIGSSASNSAESASTGVGSSFVAGGALNMLAAGDIVLEGGSYVAKTVSLDASNVITKAAQNTYSSSSSSSSSGITMGNGSIGAGSQAASDSFDMTQHGNAQIVAADGISIVAKKTVDIGGLDAAVLNKAAAADASATDSGSADAGAAENAPALKAKAPAPGFDINALRTAVAGGTTADFIASSSQSGMGAAAAMVDMSQAATGELAISGENIVSTKYKDTYSKTSESSGTYVGIGVTSGGAASGSIASGGAVSARALSKIPESGSGTPKLALSKSVAVEADASGKTADGGSVGIGFSAGSSYRKESTSEQRDNINNLSADNIVLNGKKGIDLKGVAIVGGSSVSLKSDGDITIAAAEVEKQHALESHSTHLDIGTSFSAGNDKGALNVTGPLEAQATIGFGVQTHSLDESSKGHVDSLISSGGSLSLESAKGDVKWTGVTASADALDIKANNFTSAAYQDSEKVSESSNSLGVNLSVGTDVGKMATSLFQGNGSKSTTLQRSSTDEVGNTIAANSVNINVKDNVTLVGGNLMADTVNIKANTVDIKAEKSTLDEHKTEVGVSLIMDGSAAFQGDKAWASIDSFTGKTETGTSTGGGLADRAGDGRVNNGKAISDELLSGRTGLSITSTETTTKGESYRNANLQFNQLAIDTTAAPGSTRGDGHVDIGGATLLGSGAGSSIGIVTGELKTTKYVDRQEVTSHDNSTFIGVAVEGHSAIADTINHEKTLKDKQAQGMTLDEGWVAAQRAADASNMAMGDAVGGSVAATVRNIDTQTRSLSTSENITFLNADNISIKTTQGNLALNGVEFNAPPVYNKDTGAMDKATGPRAKNISLDSAKDISLTAAKSTYSETSTTLTNDFNVTGSGSISGTGSGVGVDVGYNGSIDKESLNRTSYSNASLSADNVSIKAKNLSLTGANVSGGNVSVDVEKDINITSVQDTQTQSTTRGNWGGSVGLNTTSVVSGNAQGGGGDSHDNYAKTAQQSGITAEKSLDVSAGGNLTLTGAKLASAGTGSVNVKGDLTANKLNDVHEKDGLFAGASGGINQGGVNAGINLEKVDQIHNATTQNSTISGVGLTVGGKIQGDNLKADGSLQTQSTTVLKDEKIAGIYVNGTGVATKSGVKKVASVVTGSGSKTTTEKPLPTRPETSVTTGKEGSQGVTVKHVVNELPVTPAADSAVDPKASKYDTNVVIVTRTKTGEIDKTVQDSANDLAGKHPENTIVLIEKEGGGFENPEALSGATGKLRVNVVGHGSDLKGDASRVADMVHEVDKATDANTSIEKVGLVACGGCSKADEKTLGESVVLQLHEKGIDTVVTERDSSVKVNPDGTKTAFDKDGKKATKIEYAVVDGVVKPASVSEVKRQEMAQQDPDRYLGKKKGEKKAGEEDKKADQKEKVLTEVEVKAVPLVVVAKKTVPESMAGKPVQYGQGESAHAISSQKMTDKEFSEYEKKTLGADAKDMGVIPVEGLKSGAKVTLSRRGSFSVVAPVDGGGVSVLRMSSHMTTRAIKGGVASVDADTVKEAADLGAPTLAAGNPNAVESTVIGLRYDEEEGLQPDRPSHAEGISGTGLDERAMKDVAKSHKVDQARIKQEVASDVYKMNRPSADQASKSGTAQTTQVHHSEPMALALHNRAAEDAGMAPLQQRPTLLLFTSIPRQACTNCGTAMATNANPRSLVSVESRDEFQGFKSGVLEFPKEFQLPDGSKPAVKKNAALVYKAVPHNTRLYGTKKKPKPSIDAVEVDEVNAVLEFHKNAKSTEKKMADEESIDRQDMSDDEDTPRAVSASSNGKTYDAEGREIRRKLSRSGSKLEREGSSKKFQQDDSEDGMGDE